jgi:hypothetical protein
VPSDGGKPSSFIRSFDTYELGRKVISHQRPASAGKGGDDVGFSSALSAFHDFSLSAFSQALSSIRL